MAAIAVGRSFVRESYSTLKAPRYSNTPTQIVRSAWPIAIAPNGFKLTGANPHGTKYSSRDLVSCGFASGAAQS
jgi:hypothetical protein